MRPRGCTASTERGFTLVEVLVALAVLSLAVVALINAQSASLATISALDDQLYAEIVAENEMVRAVITPTPLPLGFATGSVEIADRSYDWQRGVFDGGLPGLQRLELTVRRTGSPQVLYELTALRTQN